MTEDVLALALVPTSLQLGPDSTEISAIGDTIEERTAKAPDGVQSSYRGALEVVEDYARATTRVETGGGPEAQFHEDRYETRLEEIRTWLTDTCS